MQEFIRKSKVILLVIRDMLIRFIIGLFITLLILWILINPLINWIPVISHLVALFDIIIFVIFMVAMGDFIINPNKDE